MRRWFLSYHSPDQALAERLKAAIERKDAAARVFFAPTHLRAGGSLVGRSLPRNSRRRMASSCWLARSGIGNWQVLEYYEAHDRGREARQNFPLVLVLLEGQTAPGLPFLRQLHWIITPDPASEKDVARLFDAAPAPALGQAISGVTRLLIAALPPWRRRTATTSSAASAKQ